MFSRFFVRRPVFAWVIAILIMLAGVLAIRTLPVGQYPDVAPPAVKISATYTGASAETLENSVTQVIEQQLTGLDHLLYFSSTSSSDGSVSITVTFEQGTDPDTAQVQVQNKVQQAESRLPSEVQQSGVTVEKSQSSFLLILAVYDKNQSRHQLRYLRLAGQQYAGPAGARGGCRQPAGIRRRIRDARLDGPDQTRLLLADAFRRSVGD